MGSSLAGPDGLGDPAPRCARAGTAVLIMQVQIMIIQRFERIFISSAE
jgi:hypothetical protein